MRTEYQVDVEGRWKERVVFVERVQHKIGVTAYPAVTRSDFNLF